METNRNIILYLIYTFLSTLSFFSPYTNLYLKENWYMSLSAIGVVILIFQITKFLFEVPTGIVADKYSRKLSAIIGYIILVISYLLLFLNNILFVYLSFFMKGVGYTFISGSLDAIFAESIDEKKLLKMNSIDRIFFFFGFGVSAILGGFLIDGLDYSSIIIIDSVVIIITLIIITLMTENKMDNKRNNKEKFYLLRSFKMIKNNKIITYFLLIDFIVAFSFVSIGNFYSTFLTNNGISISIVGIIIAFQLFISSIFGFLVHNKFKKLNKINTYMIFSVLFVALILPIYIFKLHTFWIITFYVSSQISFSIFAPIKYELTQANIDSNLRSTILSIRSLMIAIGGITSYLIISLLGNILTLNSITSILLILTLISYVIINIKLFPHIKLHYNKETL